MVEGTIQSSIQGVSSTNFLSGGSALCGPDLMTAVEMMLVQDYDDQMRSKAAEVKTATKVKKAYREVIQQLNQMLMRESKKVDYKGDNDDKKDSVAVSQSELNFLNEDISYVGNSETLSVEEQSTQLTGDDHINGTTSGGSLYVTKESIEAKIEAYKMKLETVDEQTELMSIDLQTLTNQRKIAFETVSQIIRKQDEGMSTIVKNIS